MGSLFVYDNSYYKQISGYEKYQKIFAGSWCFNDWQNTSTYSQYDFWKSAEILSSDIEYIEKLTLRVTEAAYKKLKSFYGGSISVADFRKIYYSWTFYILFKLYGNWKLVDVCEDDVISYSFDIDYKDVLAKNLRDSNNIYYYSKWNQFVIGQILKFRNINTVSIRCHDKQAGRKKSNVKSRLIAIYSLFQLQFFKKRARSRVGNWILYYFSKPDDLLKNNQKNKSDTKYIQLLYHKFGRQIEKIDVDEKFRLQAMLDFKVDNSFEAFIAEFYFKILPVSLLEGIHVIENFSLCNFFGSKPKSVVYSDFLNNELLLYYLRIIDPENIFVYQHGGGFGLNNYTVTEIVEKFFCSRYITWGWKSDSKDIPFFGPILNFGKRVNSRITREGICIMLYDSPPYIPVFQPTIYSGKFSRYLLFIKHFLVSTTLKDMVVRFYPRNDSSVDLVAFFPSTIVIDSSHNLDLFYSKYKLYIYTYNSTGFLELWNLNIPCILFIEEENWFTNDYAGHYYLELKKAGLLFSDVQSLNSFLELHKDNITEWWQNEEIQGCISDFLQTFCRPGLNRGRFFDDKEYDKRDLVDLRKVFVI